MVAAVVVVDSFELTVVVAPCTTKLPVTVTLPELSTNEFLIVNVFCCAENVAVDPSPVPPESALKSYKVAVVSFFAFNCKNDPAVPSAILDPPDSP